MPESSAIGLPALSLVANDADIVKKRKGDDFDWTTQHSNTYSGGLPPPALCYKSHRHHSIGWHLIILAVTSVLATLER